MAKERLKLVLIHDKANVSPEFLEMVKGEIIKVIKKYMEIDEESLDIQLTKTQSDAGDRIVPALALTRGLKKYCNKLCATFWGGELDNIVRIFKSKKQYNNFYFRTLCSG